jgi:hypothetical protein
MNDPRRGRRFFGVLFVVGAIAGLLVYNWRQVAPKTVYDTTSAKADTSAVRRAPNAKFGPSTAASGAAAAATAAVGPPSPANSGPNNPSANPSPSPKSAPSPAPTPLPNAALTNPAAAPNADTLATHRPTVKGFPRLEFSRISKFELSDTLPPGQSEDEYRSSLKHKIPEDVRQLDGQPVTMVGFMVPIDVTDAGKVKAFGLMPNQLSCCFGVAPAVNGWVYMVMPGDTSIEAIMDSPIEVRGKFTIKPEIESHQLVSLYRMEPQKVAKAGE